jgi:hypothetical protein
MAEETTVTVEPEVTSETKQEETTTETTTSYFGADGALNDGWQSTLPEDYRDERSLASVKDAKVLAKMFVDTKRMVGKDKIAIPSDTSSEAEWEEYYKAGGRPETVADYAIKVPDDFPKEVVEQVFPEGRIAKWQERFFKGGVSKKAADAFVAEFAQDMLEDYKNMQLAKQQQRTELVNGLNEDWGSAFDQNKHLGDIAVTEGSNGDFEFQQRLSAKFGNDPDFVRFSANLGAKFAEGKPPNFAAVPTPTDLKAEIAKLMEDPLYLNGTKQQRDRLIAKVMALRDKMPKPANT